jgi:hypothetical protein
MPAACASPATRRRGRPPRYVLACREAVLVQCQLVDDAARVRRRARVQSFALPPGSRAAAPSAPRAVERGVLDLRRDRGQLPTAAFSRAIRFRMRWSSRCGQCSDAVTRLQHRPDNAQDCSSSARNSPQPSRRFVVKVERRNQVFDGALVLTGHRCSDGHTRCISRTGEEPRLDSANSALQAHVKRRWRFPAIWGAPSCTGCCRSITMSDPPGCFGTPRSSPSKLPARNRLKNSRRKVPSPRSTR